MKKLMKYLAIAIAMCFVPEEPEIAVAVTTDVVVVFPCVAYDH